VARAAALPKITASVSKDSHKVVKPSNLRPGRFAIQLDVHKAHATLGFVKFKAGYNLKMARNDIFAVFGANDLEALHRFNQKTIFFGGLGGNRGETVTGTVVLPRGNITMYEFGGNDLVKLGVLRIRGKAQARPAPHTVGKIAPQTGARWGGSKSLPHKGTVKFVNEATDTPHFVDLQQVAKGTTRAEVIACLNDQNCDFGFARAGHAETEVLDQGKSMTFDYDLPRGTYVLMCFYPDEMTGMPHALMGMVRIITLK